jgi:hypothetical protein
VSRGGRVRLIILGAAVACLLVGLHQLPQILTGTDLGRPPTTIVNDTPATVVVGRCTAGCTDTSDRVSLRPHQSLRVGAAARPNVWAIEDNDGVRLGCLTATSSAEPLAVSSAGPCQS